jgi:pyrroloquinoline quinone biosynthesis protein B
MGRLTAIVLGSAAGGGYPQWNCRCAVCRLAWEGDKRVRPRTQTSVAVSADGTSWTLLNAAPELRAQIAATPALMPLQVALHHVAPIRVAPHTSPSAPDALRGSPIAAVVLTGAEIDQTAGLLNLRERGAFGLYATAETHNSLTANPMFDVLDRELVPRRTVVPGVPFGLPGGLTAELFIVAGKVPLYLESGVPDDRVDPSAETGVNVGVLLSAGGAKLAFIPGAAVPTPELMARCAGADVVMFDATLFTDDEMIVSGTGQKTGRRMGHMPIDGAGGSLEVFASLATADLRARRVYIHINNTNPILVEGSPQRQRVEQAGWEVAYDGMEITL